MTPQEFFNKNNGVGLNIDKVFGNQCVDVFLAYNRDVVNGPGTAGNAIDYWTNYPTAFYDKIFNTAEAIPQKGDVMIWNIGRYGHIAIFSSGDVNEFISFDQNWPVQVDVNGVGFGVCHFQPHNYVNVVGWLRPKVLHATPTPTVPTPPAGVGVPLQDVIANLYRALTGQSPSQNEIEARILEYRAGKPISSIAEDIIRGDTRYQDRWVKPVLDTKLGQVKTVLYGKGWPWSKVTTLKQLLPL